MSLRLHLISEGIAGALLGDLPGVTLGGTPEETLCEAVIVDAAKGLSLSDWRARLPSCPALLIVAALKGVSALTPDLLLAAESGAPPDVVSSVVATFSAVGRVHVVTEEQLWLALRVRDSLPPVVLTAAQGMEAAAVAGGLEPKTARLLVGQTLMGTAVLLADPRLSPAELKDRVASPSGTTIAGLAALEDRAVRGACLRAVEDCVSRGVDGPSSA